MYRVWFNDHAGRQYSVLVYANSYRHAMEITERRHIDWRVIDDVVVQIDHAKTIAMQHLENGTHA
jgi:phage anti-repressor protein